MKSIVNTILLFVCMAFFAACKKVSLSEDDEKNEKIIYTMGSYYGEQLKGVEPDKREKAIFIQGVKDGLEGKKQIDVKKYAGQVRTFFRERGRKMAKKMEEKGAEYMEKFIAEEGGMRTESGIGYKILREGTGENPVSSDRVKVHYHGTLIDGSIFDSSVEKKNPVSFPLNGVIKCWKEGVPKIKVGGKVKLVCPADVAYGMQGRPPKIPGGSTLIFDVELLEIVPGGLGGLGVSKKEAGKAVKKKKSIRTKGKK